MYNTESFDLTTLSIAQIDEFVSSNPVEVLLDIAVELTFQIHASGMRAWKKLSVVKRICEKVGVKKISKSLREFGYKFNELKQAFLCLAARPYLDDATFDSASLSQLKRIGKIDSEEIIDYIPMPNATMLDIADGIKEYIKAQKENLPPKEPKKSVRWEYVQGGASRKAVFELQDTEDTRTLMQEWEESKDKITVDKFLTQASRPLVVEKEVVVAEVVEPETIKSAPALPVVSPVKQVSAPKPYEGLWEPGMRCLPIYNTTFTSQELYNWTKGEFPVVQLAVGDVVGSQAITLIRVDGKQYLTHSKYIAAAPTLDNDIFCEHYLRKIRIHFSSLIESKASDDEEGIMTHRIEFSTFKYKLKEWAQNNQEYLDYVYREIQKVESQYPLALNA